MGYSAISSHNYTKYIVKKVSRINACKFIFQFLMPVVAIHSVGEYCLLESKRCKRCHFDPIPGLPRC